MLGIAVAEPYGMDWEQIDEYNGACFKSEKRTLNGFLMAKSATPRRIRRRMSNQKKAKRQQYSKARAAAR
jgi:hypothetical protein